MSPGGDVYEKVSGAWVQRASLTPAPQAEGWYSGVGAPAGGLGAVGDWYLDTTPGTASGGGELDYVQVTADVGVTGGSEGSPIAVVTGTSRAYDGTKNHLEFSCAQLTQTLTSVICTVLLFRGATLLGTIGRIDNGASATFWPIRLSAQDTPPAGTFAYSIKAFTTNLFTFKAGVGGAGAYLPMYLRVTKA